MAPAPDMLPAGPLTRMRRLVYELRTEGGGPARDAAAVGVGVFIGCSPFYGFHLLLSIVAGTLLRLNRLKIYLAANISNPLVAPVLVLTELQVGALVRRGHLHSLTLEAVRQTDPWRYAGDLLVGSLVVGAVLAAGAAAGTALLTRGSGGDPLFADLVHRAADRFVTASITAWEFAKGKLRGDPVYRSVLLDGQLRSGGTLVDVGCGTGLMLALLAEASAAVREGRWPAAAATLPVFDRLIGIELRPRAARIARGALGEAATIVTADARTALPPAADALIVFDVLHMMSADGQRALLRTARDRLTLRGVVLVREADADAGWRFRAVHVGNRLKALALGHWRQSFHFRGADDWAALFHSLGFAVERGAMGQGTPFANVLFRLTPVAGRGPTDQP